MTADSEIKREMISLAKDIKATYKAALSSGEFKQLEKDVVKGTKTISTALTRAFRSAKKSPRTVRLTKKVKKVVGELSDEGRAQAKKAHSAALKKIKQVRSSIRKNKPK